MVMFKYAICHYWWSSFITTKSWRAKQCKKTGMHKPQLIDMGTRKLCFRCGAW